ncbi:DUF2946 family protein [Lysobacter niastensis]|uniref:DUF2946 family protein n=1 Tax=Lysobacter niastensis TaxID=380629 RepID=A0ABS0B4H0_9GAMM|nr:DUF2946 family protein [Lysobacter niastensis]MBF6023530.1 DUF2946 family protein [Lysobacter niastensis]
MRSPAFHLRMSLLALAAMLLLLAVPTAGRVLASSSDDGGTWAQICTMAGLKLVKIAPGDSNPLQPEQPGNGMPDGDCAYCPILGAMAALLVWVAFVLLPSTGSPLRPRREPLPRTTRHPCGLGSRGPPIAL